VPCCSGAVFFSFLSLVLNLFHVFVLVLMKFTFIISFRTINFFECGTSQD
jgi:hypothetical protein